MDEYSFEIVFRNHYSKAYYLAFRILHDDEASKDIVSDAFELVWKRVDIRSRYVLASMKETEMVVNSV